MSEPAKIAYFSMEIGLDAEMPTYSGGLGILAGDTIRSAADFRVPMVAMTLLHRKGYFYQRLDPGGWQTEQPSEWVVDDFVKEMPQRVCVAIEGRSVHIRAWKFDVEGISGSKVPVYFLDADLPENSDWDRRLTDHLYGGDRHYRLCQEVILGIGGVRMLRALGYDQLDRFHMNEGHAALLSRRLLEEEAEKAGRDLVNREDIEAVRKKCIFTTHTPVPAGHDQFPLDMVRRVLGTKGGFIDMKDIYCANFVEQVLGRGMAFFEGKDVIKGEDNLNMTFLALNLSHYVNGVAKKHGEVSRTMFGEHVIDSITNGVHAVTWTTEPFRSLYDKHIAGWRQDNFSLRNALNIPKEEIWNAHMQAKKSLLRYVNHETNAGLDECCFTVGFARRAAAYKRADLLFSNIDRLRAITSMAGKIQIIYAGKAHPQDQAGKELIKRIFQARDQLASDIKVVYLENYDIDLGKMITSGVDLWLNTPVPPLEASGTSGMKAALNGVPSLSVLDGWWIEGHIEGVTGWSIGENGRGENIAQDRSTDAGSLYDKLERVIIPSFYNERERFIEVMRHAIALNGSFFNTHRMIQQYVLNAYFL